MEKIADFIKGFPSLGDYGIFTISIIVILFLVCYWNEHKYLEHPGENIEDFVLRMKRESRSQK